MNNPTCPAPAHGGAVITARVKAQPEHFVVREWLGFAPDGDGDHMLVTVRKRGANTLWVAKQLARHADVDSRDVGFAGLKDRHAITEQSYTVPSRNLSPEAWLEVAGEGFEVIGATKHRRKLKRGAHKGNEFAITLTDVSGDEAVLLARLETIKQLGVPNYFGSQRFGHDGHNLKMAQDWFANDQRIFDRTQRSFALSAARALIFNAVLQLRVEQSSWNRLLAGDLANLNGSNSVFAVDTLDDVLINRCAEFDIHPSGPMWGAGELLTHGATKELEQLVGQQHEIFARGLSAAGLNQERRALRVQVRDFNWTLSDSQLVLRFTLNKGSFATVVIAELLGATANSLAESEDI